MKLRTIGAACASVFFVTGYQAVAQDTGLPKVLRIYREEVKQGKDAAHEKAEANFARVAAKYKSPVYYLGCNVVAGPSEATALGNIVMQMVGRGAVESIAEGREIVSRSFPPKTFLPEPRANWDAVYDDFAHHCRNLAQ